MKRRKKKMSLMNIILLILLLIYAFSLIGMIAWGLISSLRDAWDFDDFPTKLPGSFSELIFDNYETAIKGFSTKVETENGYETVSFLEMIVNTLLYAGGSALMVTIMPCITAYIATNFKFKILNIYYIIVVVCMALPIIGSSASELQMAQALGIYNTIWGMWLMKGYFIGMYFLVFYASFKSLPRGFTEAAEIDGAGNFTIMTKVVLPLVRTTFTTIFLIQFINFWNDYQTPNLFLRKVPTLAVGLFRFMGETNIMYSNPPTQMAGSMILLIPILLIYILLQKRLIGSVTMGGLKE